MPHVLNVSSASPLFIMADYPDFSEKFSVERLYEFTEVLRSGQEAISEECLMPEVLVLDKRLANLPDFFKTLNGMLVCSNSFRKLLQGVDPELHQFFPIEITFSNGDIFPDSSFFVVNVFAKKKTINVAKSSVHIFSNGKTYGMGYGTNPIYFSKEVLEGANLWREDGFRNSLFMSDELMQRSKQEKLRIFSPLKPGIVMEHLM